MAGEQTSKVQNAPTAAWLDVDKPDVSFGWEVETGGNSSHVLDRGMGSTVCPLWGLG